METVRYLVLARRWKKVNRPQPEIEILPPSSTMMDTYAFMLSWCIIWPCWLIYLTYKGWNFNSGNYLFTTDTK